MPPPYQGMGIEMWRSYGRRFNGVDVSTTSCSGIHCSMGRYLNASASKPPPEHPLRYSRSLSGGLPVSACIKVDRMRSDVQRASPKAGGRPKTRLGHV